jgi:DNA (cytosine-5)-methyltransferase 1
MTWNTSVTETQRYKEQVAHDARQKAEDRLGAFRGVMLHAARNQWTKEQTESVVGALDVSPVRTGKPRLLDLFCGAGGASKGYIDAGWDVMGLDNVRQPFYPNLSMGYVLADFREFGATWIAEWFDAVHASPPCQAHSAMKNMAKGKQYHDLIPEVRELLQATGLPYVIENVEHAPLHNPILLCGDMFGLRVTRHRLFESNVYMFPGPCTHERKRGKFLGFITEKGRQASEYRDAMGCDWMSVEASRQAIPPIYAKWIGEHLMAHISKKD